MKTNAIIRILLWSLVIIVLVGILVGVILGVNVFRSFQTAIREEVVSEDVSLNMEEGLSPEPGKSVSIDPSRVDSISIAWAAGSIRISAGDGEQILFSESAKHSIDSKNALVYDLHNGELEISFRNSALWKGLVVGDDLFEKDLTITVPRDWVCRELEIDAASAKTYMSGLPVDTVDFDGASGECQFDSCIVEELDLDTASGDVRFVGSLNALDWDAASASIYAELTNIPRNLDLDTMSGDLEITLPENAGFTLSMDALSSNFSSDFETTLQGGNYVCGKGHCRIQVDGLSGNVCIRKHGLTADSAAYVSAGGHLHTEACQLDPSSCPDNHHEHTDTCQSDPGSCPDNHHTHTEFCQTEPASCPDTSHDSGSHNSSHSDKHGH